jgi:hypothetical protein
LPPTVTGLDAITKILLCSSVVASDSLLVRIIIILFSSVRRSTFQKPFENFQTADPRYARGSARQVTRNGSDETQTTLSFGVSLTGSAESHANSRMMRAQTIGVMLMAPSVIEKKSQGRENRAEPRATDSQRRTRRKRSSRRWLNSSSCYFFKRLKTDIS